MGGEFIGQEEIEVGPSQRMNWGFTTCPFWKQGQAVRIRGRCIVRRAALGLAV